jgi:site-specific recombinase XerD
MYVRKLPSGRWQATVRHPSGKRITKTDPLKKVVADWGRDLESQFARGDVRDPRAGRITVGDWQARWIAARGIERVTRDKLDSIWRTHCQPQWATWPMDAVTVMEAQMWVKVMQAKRHNDQPLSASTVLEAVHLMSSLYRAATRERPPLVVSNPFTGLELPKVGKAPYAFFDHDEAEALLAAVDDDRWRLLVEVGMWMGLRPGELYGLPGTRVDWLRQAVHVVQVKTRHGLRQYPKSLRSFRVVPMHRPDLVDDLSTLLAGRSRDGLLFALNGGGAVDDSYFRRAIWYPAIRRAGVRALPPRAMRHTAASWLVMDGVDLYRVRDLLGHESITTTQRYAHLAPEAHEKLRDSWRRMRDARRSGGERDQGSDQRRNRGDSA